MCANRARKPRGCRRRLGRGGPASSPARSRHRALFPRSRRASNPGVAVSAHRKGTHRRHFRFLLLEHPAAVRHARAAAVAVVVVGRRRPPPFPRRASWSRRASSSSSSCARRAPVRARHDLLAHGDGPARPVPGGAGAHRAENAPHHLRPLLGCHAARRRARAAAGNPPRESPGCPPLGVPRELLHEVAHERVIPEHLAEHPVRVAARVVRAGSVGNSSRPRRGDGAAAGAAAAVIPPPGAVYPPGATAPCPAPARTSAALAAAAAAQRLLTSPRRA